MELTKLFNDVRKTSYYINKKNRNVDGFKFWQPIKKILGRIDGKASKWIKQNNKLTRYVMNEIPEFVIFPNKKEQIIEHNHFIIQTIRIPLQEKPTIKKIIQVALNIGQCKGYGTKYNHLLKNRTKITDYVSHKDIVRLSKLISKEDIHTISNYLTKWINK